MVGILFTVPFGMAYFQVLCLFQGGVFQIPVEKVDYRYVLGGLYIPPIPGVWKPRERGLEGNHWFLLDGSPKIKLFFGWNLLDSPSRIHIIICLKSVCFFGFDFSLFLGEV